MNIDVVSVNDKNGLDRVYMLLNSLKKTKQDDTVVNYYLFVEDVDDEVKQYFKDLISADFRIQIEDTSWFKERINSPYRTYLYYVRCLFPSYFTWLDKILYLDTDIVFLQNGVEQLWETNVDNYSLGAVSDITVNYFKPLAKIEKDPTKTKDYFNSGVLLMNLKRIREANKHKQLQKWMLKWNLKELKPSTMDQTLLNYIFREDEVNYLDYKYNDYSLVITKTVYSVFKQKLNKYSEPIQSVKDAIILHFLGELKPWRKDFNNVKHISSYPKQLEEVWKEIEKNLKKS